MNILILVYFWPENFRINELTTELSKKLKIHVLLASQVIQKNFFKKKIKIFKNLNINRVPYLRDGTMFSKYLNYISFVISASFYLLLKIKLNS